MRFIRRLDNPLIIKTWGFVGPGALGPFDANVYEEVVGELPDGYEMEALPASLVQRLSAIFEGIPREGIDPAIRGHFRILQAAVSAALTAVQPDEEAAQALIENAKMPDGSPLPAELEAFQTALLEEF